VGDRRAARPVAVRLAGEGLAGRRRPVAARLAEVHPAGARRAAGRMGVCLAGVRPGVAGQTEVHPMEVRPAGECPVGL
jgi:hypothetical protein